ncbi:TPA: DUF551 domain-containing protein [Klebsiella michiganensis]
MAVEGIHNCVRCGDEGWFVGEMGITRCACGQAGNSPVITEEDVALQNYRAAMEGISHIRRTLEETFGGLHGTHVEPDVLMDCKSICDAIYAAYRGNSPVIPEGLIAAVNRLLDSDGSRGCYSAIRCLDAREEVERLLAAAPHDTPALNSVQSVVTVPGKWIPVSERIPEDRKQVILWDAEIGEVTSGHYSHKTQTFYHCGDAIENEITHWMPPPCAPQEVK